MDNKKLFIATPIPPNLVNSWHHNFTRLNLPNNKLKIVPPDNFHLTLKFLGYLPLDKLLPIIETIKKVAEGREEFELIIDKPEIFPPDKTKSPRVLTIGLQHHNQLQELYDDLEQALWSAGLAHKEPRKFTPHITLARVKQAADFREFEDFINWHLKGTFPVNCLQLMESVAGKLGPEYIVLEHLNF